MPTPEVGLSGQIVAKNVKRLREVTDTSLRELEARLRDLGRPILASGLLRIERGQRRVDIDDLVAIAAALGVTPARLLDPDAADGRLSAIDLEKHRELFVDALRAVLAMKARGLPLRGIVDYIEFVADPPDLPSAGHPSSITAPDIEQRGQDTTDRQRRARTADDAG